VEEFGGVGGVALDAEEDIEGGGAGGRNGHGVIVRKTEDPEDAEVKERRQPLTLKRGIRFRNRRDASTSQ
jgi:hypothetical protein